MKLEKCIKGSILRFHPEEKYGWSEIVMEVDVPLGMIKIKEEDTNTRDTWTIKFIETSDFVKRLRTTSRTKDVYRKAVLE